MICVNNYVSVLAHMNAGLQDFHIRF